MIALIALSLVAGIATVAIHITGARGPALPYTATPIIGGGLYADVWPLDTTAHFLAGVSLGSAAYAVLTALGATGLIRLTAAVAIVTGIGLAWEYYELEFWDEDAKGRRRWFEDTQADMLAVISGTLGVGVLVALGTL